MKNKHLIPTLLIATLFISATTAGIVKLATSFNNEPNAPVNRYVTLYGNGGNFYISDTQAVEQVTRIVKDGTPWSKFSKNMPTPTNPGFDIMGWQYTYDDALPVSAEWTDLDPNTFVFEGDARIKVKEWSGAEPSNFATDSWATLLTVINQGLGKLKETYQPSYGTFIIQNLNDADEVAAKTRTIELKGMGEYRVRVIGENHDKIVDDPSQGIENKVATLTFEFVDAVEPSLGFSKDMKSDSWDKSYVREYLENTLFPRLPSPIADPNVIRNVWKTTLDTDGDGQRVFVETQDRMFLPSLSELGYDVAPDGSNETEGACPFGGPINYVKNEIVSDEGDAYPFYQKNYLKSIARLKYYTDYAGETITVPYWTRSPFKHEVYIEKDEPTVTRNWAVHSVGANGQLAYADNRENTWVDQAINAVAPCFCLGCHDEQHSVEIDTSIDDTIVAAKNNFISNNADCYINLYDNRDLTAPTFPTLTESLSDYFTVTIGNDPTPIPRFDEDEGRTNYTFDPETGVLVLNISDNYLINDTVHVKLNCKQVNGNFCTTGWDEFITVSNQGYDKLVETYEEDYKANGNTFVGLKRKVRAHSYFETDDEDEWYEYYVRVIGENHDTLTNGKTAPLTFSFTRAFGKTIVPPDGDIPFSDYDMLTTFFKYSGTGSQTSGYSDSAINIFLNDGYYGGLIPPMLNLFEPDLANGIQECSKLTAEMQEDATFKLIATPAKLFILSYEEMTDESDLAPLSGEGSQYAYYANSSSGATRKAFLPFSNGVTDESYGSFTEINNYSTRTILKDDSQSQIAVTGINGAITSINRRYAASIIPSFVIGVNP